MDIGTAYINEKNVLPLHSRMQEKGINRNFFQMVLLIKGTLMMNSFLLIWCDTNGNDEKISFLSIRPLQMQVFLIAYRMH